VDPPFLASELLPSLGIRRRRSSVVRRKPFQKSSALKVLNQWKPNLVRIITMVSNFKIVSGDAVHQPTWPLLLKIENDQHSKIYLPCNFEVNLITHLRVIALFTSIFS
jgi:hypothetical protein